MNHAQILASTAHRPWPLPNAPWIMRQTWHDLIFMHWPVPIATMRALVPPQLPLDTYEGQAWVGVVPFRMSGVRPRYTFDVPGLSAFPELNVRTYVTSPDANESKPGVWFFSLEAANPLAVAAARGIFKLPYFNAKMLARDEGNQIVYSSHRTHRGAPPADFAAAYGPTDGIYHAPPGSLDRWLAERYCLYTVTPRGQVLRAEIHHEPWPLQPAMAEITVNSMAMAAGITLPDTLPLLHFARRQDVLVWPIEKVDARVRTTVSGSSAVAPITHSDL